MLNNHPKVKTPPSQSKPLGPPPQPPFIPTAAPETLHGETNLHSNNYNSPPSSSSAAQSQLSPSSSSAQSQSSSPSLASAPSSLSISKHPLTPALMATQHLNPNTQLHMAHHHLGPHNLTSNLPPQKTISLSEYLRPPFNAPIFHPVKLPGPRPFPGPLKKLPGSKPILPQHLPRHPPGSLGGGGGVGLMMHGNGPIPQPSVIVNHYRKPVPTLLRPFFKENPFPLQPLAASVLLLGQPTELTSHRKTDGHHKKPIIPVPYGDLTPQGSLQKPLLTKMHGEKIKPHQKIPHPVEKVKPYDIPL
ncbi:protein Skeletor, isoforms D/E-like, partial [Musca vetustissima]|uniref:protein Skeletor, isoforms D/E-like n=1 Tax=Musca vetustissima TaxID=27455 RepID=UPI002AB716F2